MPTRQTIPPSFWRPRWAAYLLAVGLTALTLAVRVAIGSRFESPTMIIFTIPVILSAYWGGLGPGLLSTVLSGLGAAYCILPPTFGFNVLSMTERWQEVMLFLAGAVISFICETLHRSRRRAEKVIAELNQAEMASTRLAAIVESSTDAIISKDLNSVIITWNNGAENVFGYTAAEMVGTSIMRLIPADRHDEENQILGKIKRGESLEHFETLRQTKDGRLIDVSVTASPIRDASGKVVGVSKVARDITERKRGENALQEAMHFAQSTIDALSAHVCVLDETGMIIATNEAWRRFAKANPPIGPAACPGDNYLKVCDAAGASGDADANLFAAGMREVIGGERVEFAMEYACHSPSEKRWFVGRVTRFPGDNPMRVVVSHENITERKLAEDARRASEARYHTLFDCAPDGIVIVDSKGYYLDVNTSICRMLGYTRDEFIGLNATDIVAPAEIPHIGQALKVIQTKSDYQREWQFRRKDGSVFAVDTIATAMPDGNLLAMIRDITERKRAEEALHQSQDHLRMVTENARVGLVMIDRERRYTFANGAYAEILGLPSANIVEQRIADVLAPLYEEQIRPRLDRAFAGERVSYELHKPTPEGDYFYAVKYEPTKVDGSVSLVVVVITDVSERKRAENSLREREEQLRLYVEHSPASIAMFDRDMKYLVASRRWIESYRVVGQSIIGRSHYEVFPEISQRWKEIHRRCLAGSVEKCDEEPFARADGTTDWIRWEVRPWHQADGSIGGIIIFSEDITNHKRSEDELRWKTAFLGAQVDSALDAILVVNNDARVILQNQRLSQLFKIPDEIARDNDDGKLLQYVTSQIKDPKQFIERVKYLYEHPDEIGRDEIELASGSILDRYSAPVRDKLGKYYGRIWTFRDITEQRKLEAQFRQAQKMESIGQLAGGVAHDFNNMLAVIQMQTELMKVTGGLSAEQHEFTDEIKATVQRAVALTRQLLLFSRREVFQPRNLDLSESITSTAKMLNRLLGEDIAMELKLAPQPMFLHADAGMMDQVLLNLTVNARDAMPNGGRLIIETAGVEFDEFAASQSGQMRPGSFVCLSVSDSGCGIPPEILPKIFEPFFTTKGVGKGTGLGLATVFGIVQQHQGWINVYSELGRGTTFRVYLPRLARSLEPDSAKPAPAAVSGGKETILLVEDDPALRLSVRKILSQFGYRVLEAPTGVKALEVWRQNRDEIRLLLTDLVMPDGMTGKDLAQRILRENPKLKVIYMSGYSAEVVGKDSPLKEGDNFLTKPFQASKLAQTIRDRLDAKI